MIGVIIIYLATIILMFACLWNIFTKAGKTGWFSLIPIYNIVILLEIVGKPIWWFLLFIVPIINLVFFIWTINLLAKSFGKSEGFTIGLIFIPVVFYPLLAFGDSVYNGPDNQI